MYRGEIWLATLPQPLGSEPGYRRPVLIVQNDSFNRSLIQTVIVVLITSNLELGEDPEMFCCQKKQLDYREIVITLDKLFLEQRVSSLSEELQENVNEGLRLVMYL